MIAFLLGLNILFLLGQIYECDIVEEKNLKNIIMPPLGGELKSGECRGKRIKILNGQDNKLLFEKSSKVSKR